MKRLILNIVIITCAIMILFPSIVNANVMLFSATKMNIKVENINEKINNIWLAIYDENCNVTDAYKNSKMNFSKASFLYEGDQYKYCAIFEKNVEPFSDEDYVFNDDYDKKNYIVNQNISYYYNYDGVSYMNGDKGKYKNAEELLNGEFFKYESEKNKNEIRKGNITCTRHVYYEANRLIEIKEIPVNQIQDGALSISISDFSELKKYREEDNDAGFALRFETEKGEYKTFKLGSNDIINGKKIDATKLEKNITIDYSAKEIDTDYNNFILSPSDIAKNILCVLCAIIVTILVELAVAKIMKINATKVIIVVNLITQILLHAFTYIVIPVIFNTIVFNIFSTVIILEILIVLIEFVIYKMKIKDQSYKKLLAYSFIANLVSFGISVVAMIISDGIVF